MAIHGPFFPLRLLEEAQLQDLEKALVLANPEVSLWHKGEEPQYIQGHLVSADLSSSVAAVCGVVLPKLSSSPGEQVLWPHQGLCSINHQYAVSLVKVHESCVIHIVFAKVMFHFRSV